ncbi:MAG TPA: hypothetical protein VJS11_06755, partial [Acidobacteriaceae bacterium]|nr:hypothetical protein [Acidobacteriaceae bacterium]
EKGEQVLREAMPYWQRAQDRMRRELGDTDWQTLLRLAGRVAQAAIRAETAPRRNAWPPAATIATPIAIGGDDKAAVIPAA